MTIITHSERQCATHTPTAGNEGVRSGTAHAEPRSHAQRGRSPRLGTMAFTQREQVSAAQMRKQLGILQQAMWKITKYARLRGCHRWLAKGAGAASLRWTRQRCVTWGNVQTSSSVWASPLSAASISKTRSEQVAKALKKWFEQDERYSVAFLTLTLAHDKSQTLQQVWDTVSDAWSAVINTGAWRGDKWNEGDAKRFGVVHWLKTVEATYGKNGWHVHIHCLLFLDKTLTVDERRTMEDRIYKRWRGGAERKGFKAPTRKHGVKIEQALREKSASELGSYMVKGALSSVADTLSREMTSGQVSKQARSEDNRTPFQILDSISRSGDFSSKNPDVQIWWEWEKSSLGRRQMTWSKGAKQALGVLDLEDAEAEELSEETTSSYEVAQVDFDEWNRQQRNGQKLRDDLVKRAEIAEYIAIAKTPGEAHRLTREILSAYLIEFRQAREPVPIERGKPVALPVNQEQARELLNIVG